MILAILSSFILAVIILFAGKNLPSKAYKWLSIFPFSLFVFFATFIKGISESTSWAQYNWIPQLGVSLDLKIDGLSLLFSLLITGIGSLIYLYASRYLRNHEYIHRFYSYLSIFMGSMLGVVLSDNLLSLFIFWELTSISSFFLIGFHNKDIESRKSALLALGITGIGGLFLLAGAVLLYNIAGTYSFYDLIAYNNTIKEHALYGLVVVFIFLGAFTKSAQFPFYSWLPEAMKAPTPVSAYLHSATMVKAGIYLLARMTPILGATVLWEYSLMIIGGITMLYGAFHSILRTDLKEILAYSTVSALGVMTFLLGIGSPHAIQATAVFIVVHALYKAALFMVAGAIDYSLGTRDITRFSGLRKMSPYLAIGGFIAALSSAGVPLTFGFIGKDLIYEATLNTEDSFRSFLTILVFATNTLLVCAGFLAGIKPFVGEYITPKKHFILPSKSLYLPPLLLGLMSLFVGIFPQFAQVNLLEHTSSSIIGYQIDKQLHLWPGFNIILALSIATLVAGFLLYQFRKNKSLSSRYINLYESLSPKNGMENLVLQSKKIARSYTFFMQSGYLRIYAIVIIVFLTVIVGYRLFTEVDLQFTLHTLTEIRAYDMLVFIIMVIATFITVATHSRLSAIISLGVVGFSISLLFVFYGAPDLAMTQFAIDTLTVVLFVLVLFKLPTYIKKTRGIIQVRDMIISVAFGTLISIITLQALAYPTDKEVSRFYAENSFLLAKGKNVVNVILVDFRGFDTMIETIVLSISAIGVYGLLKYTRSESEKEIQQ